MENTMVSSIVKSPKTTSEYSEKGEYNGKPMPIPTLRVAPEARKIPLLDLTRKYKWIEAELRPQWDAVFSAMRLLNGPNLAAFESEFAAYCGVKWAVGVASGTDAIYLSLQTLGIGDGDDVILPAHAPAPVIEPVLAVGATPVLIDKAVADYGPNLKGLANAITSKTKAILAVHMLGMPCDMDSIIEIAGQKNIPIIVTKFEHGCVGILKR